MYQVSHRVWSLTPNCVAGRRQTALGGFAAGGSGNGARFQAPFRIPFVWAYSQQLQGQQSPEQPGHSQFSRTDTSLLTGAKRVFALRSICGYVPHGNVMESNGLACLVYTKRQ